MPFEIPIMEDIEESPYPYVTITPGDAEYLTTYPNHAYGNFAYTYAMRGDLGKAFEHVEGDWCFWPRYLPRYVIFETKDDAMAFRLAYKC